jgi:hypothetical protein
MAAVKRLFGDRIISRNANIAWPPQSPDLSVCAYFLWGYLKSVVYQTRLTNLAQLKTQIEENIANIPENTMRTLCKIFRIDLLNVYSEMDST